MLSGIAPAFSSSCAISTVGNREHRAEPLGRGAGARPPRSDRPAAQRPAGSSDNPGCPGPFPRL